MSKSMPLRSHGAALPENMEEAVVRIGLADMNRRHDGARMSEVINRELAQGWTHIETFSVEQPVPAMGATGLEIEVYAVFRRPTRQVKGESAT